VIQSEQPRDYWLMGPQEHLFGLLMERRLAMMAIQSEQPLDYWLEPHFSLELLMERRLVMKAILSEKPLGYWHYSRLVQLVLKANLQRYQSHW
jgi:hypothetical protein